MNKLELSELVRKISRPPLDLSEDALDALVASFEDNIPHPGGSDLIFYPQKWRLDSGLSEEEIVSAALSWRPKIMAMPITNWSGHPFRKDLACYNVSIRGSIDTQVVGPRGLEVGRVYAVALSGVELPDGRKVRHGIVHRVFSAGEILGTTDKPPGTVLTVNDVLKLE